MTILHIQHEVRDFATWKTAFDQAAQLRTRGNVRRYVISRPIDQPLNVLIDLEFDDRKSAETYLGMLQAKCLEHVAGAVRRQRRHSDQYPRAGRGAGPLTRGAFRLSVRRGGRAVE
jgi:hypothetical protein